MADEVGDTLQQIANGVRHEYLLLAVEDHTTKAGHPTKILKWRCICPACQGEFEVVTTRQPPEFMPRGCKAHRPWVKFAAQAEHATSAKRTWDKSRWRFNAVGRKGKRQVAAQPAIPPP